MLREWFLARIVVVATLFCVIALVSATTTMVLFALVSVLVGGAAAWWLALRTLGGRADTPGSGRPVLWPWLVALAWTLVPMTLPSKPGLHATLWVVAVVGISGLWLTSMGRLEASTAR